MVVEAREDHSLQHAAERDSVVEHLRRDRRLAVGDAHAEHLPDDDLRPRGERRPAGHFVQARVHGSDAEQGIDQRGDVGAEGRVRREQGVDAAPRRCHVDHADIVEVRKRYAERLDEPEPVRSAPGEEHPVDRVQQPHETDRDVSNVDDAVVGEDRRVCARVRQEPRVGANGLERALGLDRPPEPLLEEGPDLERQIGVELRGWTPLLHRHTVAAGYRRWAVPARASNGRASTPARRIDRPLR